MLRPIEFALIPPPVAPYPMVEPKRILANWVLAGGRLASQGHMANSIPTIDEGKDVDGWPPVLCTDDLALSLTERLRGTVHAECPRKSSANVEYYSMIIGTAPDSSLSTMGDIQQDMGYLEVLCALSCC